MDLADQYKHQYSWRDWKTAYETLPSLQGKTVLDLGCGVGDQSADLARLGATVMGVDANAQLVAAAASRGIPGAAFQTTDLRQLQAFGPADGIWSSFTAAYFTDLTPVLSRWREWLNPGGWIALTEVDDLFGHQPLPSRARDILDSFTAEALHAGRYDFFMGRKLATHMESAGFDVVRQLTLADQELSFQGPAASEVLDAWASRMERLKLLQAHAGPAFPQLRADLLSCLASADHRSTARVCFCLAVKNP